MSAILTIDIGNTAMKCAFWRDGTLEQTLVGTPSPKLLETMLMLNTVEGVSVCCVGKGEAVREALEASEMPHVWLDSQTPVPIEVNYDRSTLGTDRLAAAVGMAAPDENFLLVDSGTALTIDLVTDMRFNGGNISPGISLRFRSLHEFTSRLPLVESQGSLPDFGYDTVTAIRAGVMGGICAEIEACFFKAAQKYDKLNLVLTGGDAPALAPLLTDRGLACITEPEAVGRGLLRIFNYNNCL